MPAPSARIGAEVVIVESAHSAAGVRGRLTAIDDSDPTCRYRVEAGLAHWATTVALVPAGPLRQQRRRRSHTA